MEPAWLAHVWIPPRIASRFNATDPPHVSTMVSTNPRRGSTSGRRSEQRLNSGRDVRDTLRTKLGSRRITLSRYRFASTRWWRPTPRPAVEDECGGPFGRWCRFARPRGAAGRRA